VGIAYLKTFETNLQAAFLLALQDVNLDQAVIVQTIMIIISINFF
jgi:hypothetical protein